MSGNAPGGKSPPATKPDGGQLASGFKPRDGLSASHNGSIARIHSGKSALPAYDPDDYAKQGPGKKGVSGPVEELKDKLDRPNLTEEELVDLKAEIQAERGQIFSREREQYGGGGAGGTTESRMVLENDKNRLSNMEAEVDRQLAAATANPAVVAAAGIGAEVAAVILVPELRIPLAIKEFFDSIPEAHGGVISAAQKAARAKKVVGRAGLVVKAKKKVSSRLKYLGRTPGKNSKTGKEVQDRMRADGKIKGKPPNEIFQASDKKWYPLKDADMAHHPKDAVTYWNETGIGHGAKSPEVRAWMNNSNNYTLDHYSANRSAGAQLGQTYNHPP